MIVFCLCSWKEKQDIYLVSQPFSRSLKIKFKCILTYFTKGIPLYFTFPEAPDREKYSQILSNKITKNERKTFYVFLTYSGSFKRNSRGSVLFVSSFIKIKLKMSQSISVKNKTTFWIKKRRTHMNIKFSSIYIWKILRKSAVIF